MTEVASLLGLSSAPEAEAAPSASRSSLLLRHSRVFSSGKLTERLKGRSGRKALERRSHLSSDGASATETSRARPPSTRKQLSGKRLPRSAPQREWQTPRLFAGLDAEMADAPAVPEGEAAVERLVTAQESASVHLDERGSIGDRSVEFLIPVSKGNLSA